ncbi:MAG: class I SAM-dependent methyltransferase [Planctomycetes bacterium]|nr:class I SAM-dependent methyltransferase [Planctomycetota bacterium]
MNWAYLRSAVRKPSLIFSMHLLRFFENKSGVIIGGRLRWHFKDLSRTVQKIINVDNRPADIANHDVDYVTDAANLFFVAEESLDFICSSHLLEHLANPLKAIAEWKRVIKEGGIIYVGVPDKRHTFDHKRDRTPLSHLIDDFEKDVDQTDTTHIAEFIEKINENEPGDGNSEQSHGYVIEDPESTVHHHVWIADDVKEIFEYMGLAMPYKPIFRHGTIHIIAQKLKQ